MLIDANIFLEVLLDQKKSEKCKNFLRRVKDGHVIAFVSSFNIDSIALVMENRGSSFREIAIFISSLMSYEGLKIYDVRVGDRFECLKLMEFCKLGYEDALTLQCALSAGCKEIVSFDKHFDKIKEIKRIEP